MAVCSKTAVKSVSSGSPLMIKITLNSSNECEEILGLTFKVEPAKSFEMVPVSNHQLVGGQVPPWTGCLSITESHRHKEPCREKTVLTCSTVQPS